jgi:hypothetical protein
MGSRRIGALGTASRLVVGLGLLGLALADNPAGVLLGLQTRELVLGLGVFPAVMVVTGLLARRFATNPLRLTGPVGLTVNTGVIIALFLTPYTVGAAALFYGASLIAAAWRGLPGCEATVISNLALRRDDQIGCPTFTPIDVLESHLKLRESVSR